MTMVSNHHNIISVCSLLDECVTMVQTWQQVGAGGGEPEHGRDTHDVGGVEGSSGTVATGLLQRFTEMQAQMKELNTWMGEKEREHTELREDIAMLRRSVRLDLVKFCNEDGRGFAPLGGNRQDCAVVACAAVSLSDAELRLPGDVLDAALATVCAPVIVRNREDVDTLYNSGVQLSCRLRAIDDDTLSALRDEVSTLCERQYIQHPPHYPRALIKCELPSDMSEANQLESGWGFFQGTYSLSEVDMQATSITSLADKALCECSDLTTVKLPSTLTQVGEYFLCRCAKLEEIDLSYTALHEIGQVFLEKCESLRSVKLPATLTLVGGEFLCRCAKIEELDLSHTALQEVGHQFLGQCTRLRSVTLPSTLTTINDMFLYDCAEFELLELQQTAVRKVGVAFLASCRSLTSVKLPNTLTVVGDGFLSGCCKLEELDLRNTSIQRVGSYFLRCTDLTALNLPSSLKTVGEYFLFSDDSEECKLKELDLSHTMLEDVGGMFLRGRKGLTVLKLPEAIIHIDGLLSATPSKIEEIYIGDTQVDSNCLARLRGAESEVTESDEWTESDEEYYEEEQDDDLAVSSDDGSESDEARSGRRARE